MIGKLSRLFSSRATEARKDEENLCAEAAAQASIAIQSQIMLASLGRGMTNLATQAGSPQSISYMLGYCKAVHRFYEQQTQIYINDGNLNLAAISSVFSENAIEQCLNAINQTYLALESDVEGTRAAFQSGFNDFEELGDGAFGGHSGLVAILGVGREQ